MRLPTTSHPPGLSSPGLSANPQRQSSNRSERAQPKPPATTSLRRLQDNGKVDGDQQPAPPVARRTSDHIYAVPGEGPDYPSLRQGSVGGDAGRGVEPGSRLACLVRLSFP